MGLYMNKALTFFFGMKSVPFIFLFKRVLSVYKLRIE